MIALSAISQEDDVFIFKDFNGEKQPIINTFDSSLNHSKVPTFEKDENDQEKFSFNEDVLRCLRLISKGTSISMVRNIVFLSVLNDLIQKPRNYQFLQIGDWSIFSDCLAEMLEKFNEKNHFYCLTDRGISTSKSNVSFLTTKPGEFILPSSRFSAVFIDDAYIENFAMISIDIFMSLKDYGKLFFLTNSNTMPPSLLSKSKKFLFDENSSLISLNVTSEFKKALYQQTPQYKIRQRKQSIIKNMNEVSIIIKSLQSLPKNGSIEILDYAISLLCKCEKIVNKIYIELNSMYIKTYFNELKESLIDYRLQINSNLKQIHYEKVQKCYQILTEEMAAYDDFVLTREVI